MEPKADLSPSDREVDRPILALGARCPDGHAAPPHRHRRGQLLYGSTGVVMAWTPDGAWVMPPERGLWIPPGVEHEARMLGSVALRNLYVAPDAAGGMPDRCQVVGIPDLMRSLLAASADVPPDYDRDGRDGALMRLILHELPRLPPLSLSLPFPAHGPLADRCRLFLSRPTPHATIDGWAGGLGMSRRTFTRLFRRETGLSFLGWRQRACLMAALPRLVDGEPVTRVALDLGYDNPASFALMFKRWTGVSPGSYRSEPEVAGRTRPRGDAAGAAGRPARTPVRGPA